VGARIANGDDVAGRVAEERQLRADNLESDGLPAPDPSSRQQRIPVLTKALRWNQLAQTGRVERPRFWRDQTLSWLRYFGALL
jgi:hypothetical protein